jgi:hypothetical protein
MYRKFLIGTLMAMGIGLMGISGSTATPVSGSALLNANTSPVEQVRYYGHYGRGYYGHRGYYGRGYYGRGYYEHRGYYGPGYGGCILGVLC